MARSDQPTNAGKPTTAMPDQQTSLDQLQAAHDQDQAAPRARALLAAAAELFAGLDDLPIQLRIDTLNQLRLQLHEHSPLRDQPVDCVQWVPAEQVTGNDYNPNDVAPPEMELLKLSVTADGFTQPIVSWQQDPGQPDYEVVDGFHRHLIGRLPDVGPALHGRLPVTVIRSSRSDRSDRQASTIRHNRARGQHGVAPMSEIVSDLHLRGKSDVWIARELGMDADEVTRLRQVSSLAAFYADQDLSPAWEPDLSAASTDPDQ